MLRVGLTGGLGSGKSTVAAMLAGRGAVVVSSDDLARAMMQPGTPVYGAIADRFGPEVMHADGELDRSALARIAFGQERAGQGRVEELNAIVHPAVIAKQAELAQDLASRRPDAVLVVESALLFSTPHAGEGGWPRRFDRVVVVTAPEPLRIERFAGRFVDRFPRETVEAAEEHRAEARRRIRQQTPEAEMVARADFVLANDGSRAALAQKVDRLWAALAAEAQRSA